MRNKMEKTVAVPISLCDHTASLSIPSIFSLFMDLAAEHAEELDIGAADMSRKGLFWLTVRTKVQVFEKPGLMRQVSAATWPAPASGVRCHRYYSICDGSKMLACGKTEWAVMDVSTGKLCKTSEVYPEGLEFLSDTVCDEPFTKTKEDFSDGTAIGTYTVRSIDIDLGKHMNNAAYIKILFGAFSCAQLDEMNIKDVEVAFRTPCFEGDTLTICRRNVENGIEVGIFRPESVKPAFVARISF